MTRPKLQQEDFSPFPNSLIDEIEVASKRNYFSPVIMDTLAAMDTPRTIVDIGCGNGVFSADLKSMTNCKLIGIDGSDYALKKAKENGFDETLKVDDLSTSILPIADQSIDLVICKDVMEHLLDPQSLAAEIARILTVGGSALVHVPNQLNLIGRIRLLFTNEIDTFNYFPGHKRWHYPHIRFFTKKTFIELFKLVGLNPELDLCGHFASPARFKKLPFGIMWYLATNYTDNFSEGITIVFRRVK